MPLNISWQIGSPGYPGFERMNKGFSSALDGAGAGAAKMEGEGAYSLLELLFAGAPVVVVIV